MNYYLLFFFFFFFKQKTAYEIVPCDWSSDVCSSDLGSARSADPSSFGTCTRDPAASLQWILSRCGSWGPSDRRDGGRRCPRGCIRGMCRRHCSRSECVLRDHSPAADPASC